MRQYKTQSGVYNESDLAVVVWVNPRQKNSKQARFLETMTSEDSSLPMAFPLHALVSHRSWKGAVIARSMNQVHQELQSTRRTKPMIIPLTIAGEALGWRDFYIPSEYSFENM